MCSTANSVSQFLVVWSYILLCPPCKVSEFLKISPIVTFIIHPLGHSAPEGWKAVEHNWCFTWIPEVQVSLLMLHLWGQMGGISHHITLPIYHQVCCICNRLWLSEMLLCLLRLVPTVTSLFLECCSLPVFPYSLPRGTLHTFLTAIHRHRFGAPDLVAVSTRDVYFW